MKEKQEMILKLQDQIERCNSWLEEEPDDVEVIEKVKELEIELAKLTDEKDVLERTNEIDKELIDLEKEIKEADAFIKDNKYFMKQGLQLLSVESINKLIIDRNSLVKRYNELFDEKQSLN